jgi:MFS family permease
MPLRELSVLFSLLHLHRYFEKVFSPGNNIRRSNSGGRLKTRYFYGYNIVVAGFFIQAVCIGAMFTYGVFFKEFQAAFGWSRALISGASSLAFLVMGAVGILAGTLNDRIGPKIIITVSGVSLGLGYMLMSQLEIPWQLYLLYGGFVGIGFSTHDVITLSTVARWFTIRRGMMSGLVKVGTGAGQLLVPLIATGLISAFGWRSAYLIIGAVSLVALVAVAQLMKRDPQGIGLVPDGGRHKARNAALSEIPSLPLSAAARTIQFWTICVAEFTIFFCLLTTIVHIVPHARDQGLSPNVAAGVLSTIGGVSMLGRIVMGTANDGIGGKRSLLICFIILISSLIWLQVAIGAWMLFVFAIIYGFAHGGLFTVMSPTVAELFGTGSHGQLFGVILFSGTIGGSVGPLLTGYIFDLTGSYRAAFILLTALAVMGLALILLLRKPKAH